MFAQMIERVGFSREKESKKSGKYEIIEASIPSIEPLDTTTEAGDVKEIEIIKIRFKI